MKFCLGILLLLLVAIICHVSAYKYEESIAKDKEKACFRYKLLLSPKNRNVILNYKIYWTPKQTVDFLIYKQDKDDHVGDLMKKFSNIAPGVQHTYKLNLDPKVYEDGRFTVCFKKNVESGAKRMAQPFYFELKKEVELRPIGK